ncbi:BlaI/MecI/CopY family transcriptional regulator [Carnobacterium gallinarum]|uniref:BlaI/MecI/CopY family transcriptional regulator n=1 Tax=Carnobacterium gallinarum TaxID=2749 RepID=UPI00068F98F7|nr:BlaI/MecI/CopY family transcriptional regulator [Carnobacterium gallinarum]
MQQVSDSELIIMKLIWENQGEMMFSELTAKLEDNGYQWKKNTILTFLSRLAEKKMLHVQKVGRLNKYITSISEESYLTQQTEDFLGKVYEGDVSGLISTLFQNEMISESEINQLKTFWKMEKDKND